ncbi:MAG: FeoB small GTPase domain-containing protein [Bacteroidales bacterium]
MRCSRSTTSTATVTSPLLTLHARPRRVALVGNPNVGKSALFGRLTGRYAVVSNYPGTTVALTQGRVLLGGEVCDLVDTPGVNALEGVLSEDEEITRAVITSDRADLVVQVADARNIRRALSLTWQIARCGKPMVLVLNMIDEARAHGIDIDTARLRAELGGVPVIETVAIEGRGLPELRRALGRGQPVAVSGDLDAASWAHQVTGQIRRVRPHGAPRIQEAIGRAVREPITGIPILAVVLYLFYLFVGVFGAQTLVDLIEHRFFATLVNPAAIALATRLVPFAFVRDLLVGQYGIITMGLTYAIGIVLPVVTTFFLMFGWLEDSGYIPRLAIFCDRTFRLMGLNGKAILPMVLGLGCDTMATMTTRILGTRKERIIAVLLLALGIPCSAQLATILGILGGISFTALLTLFGVVLAQMFLVGFLAARVLPGDRSDFILELPPIRLPSMRNLLRKTAMRVRWYLGEAVPLFLLGTLLLFFLDWSGGLRLLVGWSQPVVTGLLGLPAQAAQVFVMGFLRRDYGAAGLYQMAHAHTLSNAQSVVALTVMTLFVPCVANFLMIVKEQGLRVGVSILAFVTVVALSTGMALNYALRLFGIAF